MKPLPAVHCRCAVTGSSIREASKGSELLIVLSGTKENVCNHRHYRENGCGEIAFQAQRKQTEKDEKLSMLLFHIISNAVIPGHPGAVSRGSIFQGNYYLNWLHFFSIHFDILSQTRI